MAKAYKDYLRQLKLLVRDTSELFKDDPYADVLQEAATKYSYDEPLHLVQAYVAGQNGALMPGPSPQSPNRTFPLPTYWDNDISLRSFKIEHPIDDTRLRDRILDTEQCEYYLKPDTSLMQGVAVLRIRAEQWIDIMPNPGDTFYLRYWGLHQIVEKNVTVADSRFYAVCDFAASFLCKLAASRTVGLGSANIDGGQANYQSQSGQWLKMQDFYYGEYAKAVLPKQEDSKPSAVFIMPTTSELHEYPQGLWPRDNDGRKNLIN